MKIGGNPRSEKEKIAKKANDKLRADKTNKDEVDEFYEEVSMELFGIGEIKMEAEEAKMEVIFTEPQKFDEDIIIAREEQD